MPDNVVIFSAFLIFCGAAVISTLALYTRQSLLIAYMLLGILFGPWGLKVIADVSLVEKAGDIGIVFLLFLVGVHLHPQNLLRMLGRTSWLTIVSSLFFFMVGFAGGYLFGLTLYENIVIGIAMMFSSTIVGLKLLPTTMEQHQHTSEIMISILLMQDLIAIVALLFIHGASSGSLNLHGILRIVISLPAVFLFVFVMERFVLTKLFARFDGVREYMFLLSIAWCLGISELANLAGLSYQIGAFIAGISIAASPIAFYIAESFKPLRDFFLVLFFFSVGASFNLQHFSAIILPAAIFAVAYLLFKPFIFYSLLRLTNESKPTSWEIGVRLGQISEFSLLVGYLANKGMLMGDTAVSLLQAITMIMFIGSSFWVVRRYPTPMNMPAAQPTQDSSLE